MKCWDSFWNGVAAGMLAMAAISLTSDAIQVHAMKRDAIKAGVAEYVIIKPESGKTQFKWKIQE